MQFQQVDKCIATYTQSFKCLYKGVGVYLCNISLVIVTIWEVEQRCLLIKEHAVTDQRCVSQIFHHHQSFTLHDYMIDCECAQFC